MFYTFKSTEFLLPGLCSDEQQLWPQVELSLIQPYYKITLQVSHEGSTYGTAFLVTSTQDIERFLKNKSKDFLIQKIYIISPDYINSSSEWQIDSLKSVTLIRWSHQERTETSVRHELNDGRIYIENYRPPSAKVLSSTVLYSEDRDAMINQI